MTQMNNKKNNASAALRIAACAGLLSTSHAFHSAKIRAHTHTAATAFTRNSNSNTDTFSTALDSSLKEEVSTVKVTPQIPLTNGATYVPDPLDEKYWEIGPTLNKPNQPPLPPKLIEALRSGTHPIEEQSELGNGVFITKDWRKAWYTYESPAHEPDLIDPKTGYAEYIIDESSIEGTVPDDLVGCLYRNGPGKFGIDGDRVSHVLDSDGLVIQVNFPSKDECKNGKREFKFLSRFVETDAMKEEERANKFLYRSTFGTSPRGFAEPPKNGLNEDPWEEPLLSRIFGSALKTDIKNSANTQVISFGGKVLALFEAGLPHQLDPKTLKTLGEDTLGGVLKSGSPVKLGSDIPEEYQPDFIGGSAHTAHPNICPKTGNLVGWHWSQLVSEGALEVTFNEWSKDDFSSVASKTFKLDGCELAPHDMALTENCIMLKVNSLKMNTMNFMTGMKGPAASLEMDGRSNVQVHVFPRPSAKHQFEPYVVEVPPCFSIHFSHAYEDEDTGNLVSFFSGWPPSDETDFLGAWGGHSPLFKQIPVTYIWKLEIDPVTKKTVYLGVAPGSANACAEHPLVHPNFTIKKAKNVYASASNAIGDSSAPCGFMKLRVDDGNEDQVAPGVKNEDIDAWWFGTRYFSGEPLIVPKDGGNPNNEDDAYLLGMVQDCVNDRSGVAIFDLERDLKNGPVSTMWLKSSIPHGLHGCFAQDGTGSSSVFC